MKTRYTPLVILIVASWVGLGQSWGGGRRAEDRAQVLAWEAFSADLSRGDCTMDSLSEQASITLPIGQVISKDEYRQACSSSMGDTTVGDTSVRGGKVVTIDRSNFSVEATVTTTAVSFKGGYQQEVSYPAAFFMSMDVKTNKLTEVRMYSQNIALLAARGYTMVPSSVYGPVIRPA
ncbi:unnamed protein product [Pylaiella littoralis]